MGIEDLGAIAAIEAFDVRVLIGLAGLDVVNRHAVLGAPIHKGLGGEFGAVVDADGRRAAVDGHQFVERRASPAGWAARVPSRSPSLLDSLHRCMVSKPHAPAVVERLGHEIERPGLVQHRRRGQRLPDPSGHAPGRPPRQIQPQGAIHPVDVLVVPWTPVRAHPIEELPEAPPRIPRHHIRQRRDDGRIPSTRRHRRPIKRRPR